MFETVIAAPAAGVNASPSLLGFDVAYCELRAAVGALVVSVVPADAGVLVELRGHIDQLTALVCEAEVRFDQFELWRDRGAGSLRGWYGEECGLSSREANRQARRVQRVESWPEVGEAWADGRLAGEQVDVIVAAVPARFVSEFAQQAAHIVKILSPLSVENTRAAMRQWVRRAENEDGHGAFRERPSGLFLDATFDGVQLSGHVSCAEAAVLQAAIHDFDVPDIIDENGDVIGETRTVGQRTVDALVAACQFAITHREGASESGRFLPHVSLVIDLAELQAAALRGAGISNSAEVVAVSAAKGWSAVETAWFTDALHRHGEGVTIEGLLLDSAAVTALSCDSVVQRIVSIGSQVIDMGRTVRSATTAQRRAIIARDRHCRAPGCRTKPKHCEVHHLDHWVNGGATNVGRMVLLCGTHHRKFHQPGWKMQLHCDATFTVNAPSGWSKSTLPERSETVHFELSKA